MPVRLAAGSYLLNSGLSKWDADEATAKRLHGFASSTYPLLTDVEPPPFAQALARSEVAIGTALLLPFAPAAVAGFGLAAFSAGLLGLYLRAPRMRREGSLRPSEQGIPPAKDVWLAAIGTSLVADGVVNRCKS